MSHTSPAIPRTVVCGIDRSAGARAATRVAAALARRLGLRLELLHVCATDRSPEPGVIHAVQVALDTQLDVHEVDVRIDAGDVRERLEAATRDAALLVVGAPSGRSLREAFVGTVTDAVAHAPARPVVVVPPGASRRAGVDPLRGRTLACGVQDDRDAPTARVAAELAAELRLSVTLLHVLQPPVLPAGAAAIGSTSALRPEGIREAAAHMFDRMRDELPGTPALRILDGPAGQALARAAVEDDAVMLALGPSARSPLAAAIVGSASRDLRRHASVPVLICPEP